MTTVIISQEQAEGCADEPQVQPAATRIPLRPATPSDEAAACAMLARCSRRSLFHRFHGPSDGVGYTRELFATGSFARTYLAWDQEVCVGMATLAPDGEGIGHLGVLVADAWQRRGVGTTLVAALLDDARARGESKVRADVLSEDEFIVAALGRAGPLKLSVTLGTYSVDVNLARAGE